MRNPAEVRDPATAAEQAVKAYIRMNRTALAQDGELLSLLMPERFQSPDVHDLQRFALDRLREENAALKAERDGLRATRERAALLGGSVKRAVLDLLDARTFEEAIEVAITAAAGFGAERAAVCVEAVVHRAPDCEGVRLILPGSCEALLGKEGSGAILSAGGELLLGSPARDFESIAAFRLRIGADAPAALYVLGAREPGRFDGAGSGDLGFFARALERAIRAWLDLPKV